MFKRIEKNLRQMLSSASIGVTALPMVPEISLYLIGEDYPRGKLPDSEFLQVLNDPPYWIFCWGSGHAFARFVLDNPGYFAGKSVLDFGCGSGVAAIACKMAGASKVTACDIDPMALMATEANAQLNKVELEYSGCFTGDEQVDVIVATDVLYDRDNYPFLEQFNHAARRVLVADSRVKNFAFKPYRKIATYTAVTIPELGEQDEFNHISIYSN